MATVVIEKVPVYEREEVKQGMRRLLSPLGGMAAFVKPGETVLLKPNLLAAKRPDEAVTTHPEVLRAVLELVLDAGGIPLVGDSPGVGGLSRVAEKSGLAAVVRETGAKLVEFVDPVEIPNTGLFKRIALARPYLEADRVINLPKLKTHGMMTMTCAVKNLFGAVVGPEKAAWHLRAGEDRDLFARILLEIYLLRKPELNIVDAIVAMEGDGPGSGDPRQVGLLLAGVNPVAVDMVAAELLGIPDRLLFLEHAARTMGIDGAARDGVTVVGCPVAEARVAGFRLPPTADVQWGLPRFLARRLRNLVTSYPVPDTDLCERCGICRDACPPGVMEMDGKALHIDYGKCIRCFCCRELCPKGAMGVKEGMLLRIIRKYV
jgi:uncharacterized protein (DUF362 family)/ferredoxin